MTRIVLKLDFEDFCSQVLALPGVVYAISNGNLLQPIEAEFRCLYQACMDYVAEDPEPYWDGLAPALRQEDLRVDVAVVQTAYGIDMAKALWAAQLQRLLDTGNFLDVSRLSDADLMALCRPKLQ